MNNVERLKQAIKVYKKISEHNNEFFPYGGALFFTADRRELMMPTDSIIISGNEDYIIQLKKQLSFSHLGFIELFIEGVEDFAKNTRIKAINSIKDEKIAQRYKKTFSYLAQEIIPTDLYETIEERLKTVLTNKEYKLPYWGINSYAEVLSKIFPTYFIRFNNRNRAVSDYLGLVYKTNGYVWKQYVSFQKEIAKPCFDLYKKPNFKTLKNIPKSALIDDFFGFVYIMQIQNRAINKEIGARSIIQAKLKKVLTNNYHSIKSLSLPKLTNEVYIVGENGVGKTLLLQAIFWAIQYPLIENDPENTLGTAWIKRNFNQLENLKIEIVTNEIDDNIYKYPKPQYQEKDKRILNFFAYGVNRQYQKGNEATYEFMSLFNSEVSTSLRNPETWLIKKYNAEFRKKSNGSLSYKKVVSFLEKLLDDKIKISIEEGRNDDLEVIFTEQDTTSIEFNLLSDGYKSVFTWLADLLSRLAENQPNADEIKDFKGVVLIDELDLFLHPKWSYNIVQKLREKLPNIQFIITTHSPILILGAGEDAVFYRMYKEEGVSKISLPMQFNNLTANSLMTSPIWDMNTFSMRNIPNNKINNANYLESKIDEVLQEKLKQKPIFSDEETLAIIKAELDKV